MGVIVKAEWGSHFHGFVKALRRQRCLRPLELGRGGAHLLIGSTFKHLKVPTQTVR